MVWATVYDGAEVVNVLFVYWFVIMWTKWSFSGLTDYGRIFFQMQGALDVPAEQATALGAATHMDHMCALDIDSRASYVRLSGIICTIGNWFIFVY